MIQLALQMVLLQVIVLLLLRPILLWYFKVNQALKLLRSIDSSLKCLPAVRAQRPELSKVPRYLRALGG
jgi:hypothetical protein